MGCRFPGDITSPESFWDLLLRGGQGIGPLPAERRQWQSTKRQGGYLNDVDQFDAQFFGISASEARHMDPQQRLLLEVAWEALEHAGIDPLSLAGRRVGVFVGAFTNDYELLQSRRQGAISPYFGTGTSAALLAGRIAYRLGLTGPALVVNTACSSSLVALHLARQSLLSGESELAVVAGVNLILSDEVSDSFEAARMLAAGARCKPWDERADGYVRSEGCAAIVLEPVQASAARGACIWARVAGSAVNQDGASGGITAPSAAAQHDLLLAALGDAGRKPDQVQYLEAHGTGTPLGDPVEFDAIGRAFTSDASDRAPLLLGSVKGNIGHTEAVAGLAGVIKTLLSMERRTVLATINHKVLNPELDLGAIPAAIPTEPTPWPVAEHEVLIAGVNSFGFSGTNAHVILERHLEDEYAVPTFGVPTQVLCLSAQTPQALGQLAQKYANRLTKAESAQLGAICHTAYAGRAHFRHRLALLGGAQSKMLQEIKNYLAGEASPDCLVDVVHSRRPRIAFLFTGQGSQYWGMGRDLFESDVAFRRTMLDCSERLAPLLGCSLADLLVGEQDSTQVLTQTRFTQPALFAFQVSLASMLRAWGVEPDGVLGHSVGEFAAAVAAGVMSLEDGLVLMEARGRLMQALPKGAMSAVQAAPDDLQELLSQPQIGLSLAVVNAPDACVIAGSETAMRHAHEWLHARGIGFIELDVSHAFHTPLMADMVQEFAAVLEQRQFSSPVLPFYSTVTGDLAASELTQAAYWCRQITSAVQYFSAVQRLDEAGFDFCLEIGPSPVLVNLARRCVPQSQAVWMGVQQPGENSRMTALRAAARLYVAGVDLHYTDLSGVAPQITPAPTYPFQRGSFWLDGSDGDESSTRPSGMTMNQAPHSSHDPALTDATTILTDYYKDLSARVRQGNASAVLRPFIRFAPFREPVAGFTWLPTFLGQDLAAEMQRRVDQAHGEMRAVLLNGIEFSRVRKVLDIGCGYSTDLVELAQTYSHVKLDGCNISGDQIDFGRRVIAQAGLDNRIQLHQLDSSRDEFPGLYDLAVSHQVIHHIQDKDAVLRNIAGHLRNGAFLVAAEIVSNLDERIDHAPSSAYFETKHNWAELLSQHHLRLVRCVDASQEIANYLHDDDFARTLRERAGHADASTVAHLHGPHALGQLLRRGVANYLLLLVQRDQFTTVEALQSENQARLAQPLPYAQVSAQHIEPIPAMIRVQAGSASAPVSSVWPPFDPAVAAGASVREPLREPARVPVSAQPAPSTSGSTPQDQIRLMVAQLLECAPEVLDTNQVLVAQGLNSILAMDLTRRLRSALGLSVSVKTLLNGATIASLAQGVQAAVIPDGGQRLVRDVPVSQSGLMRTLDTLDETEINRLLHELEARRDPRPTAAS